MGLPDYGKRKSVLKAKNKATKPCPACLGSDTVVDVHTTYNDMTVYYVRCNSGLGSCPYVIRALYRETVEEAISNWDSNFDKIIRSRRENCKKRRRRRGDERSTVPDKA